MTPNFSKLSPLNSSEPPTDSRVWRISQSYLNRFEFCPRWFQDTILERREPPLPPEQQERLAQGNRFHYLMQQRELGLPTAALIAEEPQLGQWLQDFLERAPQWISPNPVTTPNTRRDAEHERTLAFEGVLLVVRYDLLLCGTNHAQILDWKTYRRPPKSDWLKRNWQTRLYPFVLAETSDYPADAISMTYWFVEASEAEESQCWQFDYSQAEHEATRKELSNLLANLTQNWQNYQEGESLPSRFQQGKDCPRSDCFCPQDTATEEIRGLTEIPEIAV